MTIHAIGPHRVRHGDATKPLDDLMGSDTAHILYSDPPWGEGNLKFWSKVNARMTGNEHVPATLADFFDAYFAAAHKYVTHYMLIEYGVRWRDTVQSRGIAAGFTPRGIINLKYRGGKGKGDAAFLPLDLHVFTKGDLPVPEGYEAAVENSYGYDTLKRAVPPIVAAVRAQIGDGQPVTIMDHCCGMGYTAQAAVDNGLIFRGNEINAARLEKTLARLRKDPRAA